MNCGERKTRAGTKRFAMIGVDLHQASPDDIEHVNAGGGNELVVVDVTDPADPAHRRACPGDDEHAHGLLHRHDRLPLRLLGR